jgi:hypothetical protein
MKNICANEESENRDKKTQNLTDTDTRERGPGNHVERGRLIKEDTLLHFLA